MGVGVYATGGETADVGDLVRTIIVDSTVTCRMKRADVINNANIRPGDVIVGLASYGQATYEKEYNGGMGSNGLTSARHDVFAKYLAEKYPESYDKARARRTGVQRQAEADRQGRRQSAGCRQARPLAHPYLCAGCQETARRPAPPDSRYGTLLGRRTDQGAALRGRQLPRHQGQPLPRTSPVPFNMGHRLEVYLSPEHAEEVIAISKSFNIDAQVIGRIEESDKKELIIRSEFGEFRY